MIKKSIGILLILMLVLPVTSYADMQFIGRQLLNMVEAHKKQNKIAACKILIESQGLANNKQCKQFLEIEATRKLRGE